MKNIRRDSKKQHNQGLVSGYDRLRPEGSPHREKKNCTPHQKQWMCMVHFLWKKYLWMSFRKKGKLSLAPTAICGYLHGENILIKFKYILMTSQMFNVNPPFFNCLTWYHQIKEIHHNWSNLISVSTDQVIHINIKLDGWFIFEMEYTRLIHKRL